MRHLDRTINRRCSTWSLVAIALVLMVLPIACGSDNTSSSGHTGEFGPTVESDVQLTEESSSNDAVETLRDLIEVVISGLLSIVWTVLRTLVCFVATGWVGVVVLVAAFLSATIYYLSYHILRYDWHRAVAVGAMASLPVLIVRILC